MKHRQKSILFAVLTVLWTGVIFSFSLQPAQASSNLSGGLLQILLSWIHRFTTLQIPVSLAHHLIRKTAHFLEFFLLGTLAYKTSGLFWEKWLPALIYGMLIAVTDETIQFFTGSGRAMRISDMLLDTAGVATAILVMWYLGKLCTRRKHKNT